MILKKISGKKNSYRFNLTGILCQGKKQLQECFEKFEREYKKGLEEGRVVNGVGSRVGGVGGDSNVAGGVGGVLKEGGGMINRKFMDGMVGHIVGGIMVGSDVSGVGIDGVSREVVYSAGDNGLMGLNNIHGVDIKELDFGINKNELCRTVGMNGFNCYSSRNIVCA